MFIHSFSASYIPKSSCVPSRCADVHVSSCVTHGVSVPMSAFRSLFNSLMYLAYSANSPVGLPWSPLFMTKQVKYFDSWCICEHHCPSRWVARFPHWKLFCQLLSLGISYTLFLTHLTFHHNQFLLSSDSSIQMHVHVHTHTHILLTNESYQINFLIIYLICS